MGLLTFKGGIHPYDGKELSKDKPIKAVYPKGDVVYPLSQHIGAPASPIVSIGEKVLMGQMIAKAEGFVSAPVYASVSGTVKAIEFRRVPTGNKVNSIIIENDSENKEVEYHPKVLKELNKEEIITRIKEAGIVGMGGAGFPTHVKLSPKEPEKIEYIIANCAECEPYLTSDYRRMMEEPEKLINGLRVILKLFDNAKGYLGIEDNKQDCIEKLQELVKNEPRIEVKVLKTKYPQGSERQLISAITNRQINSSMLPADAGCIVNNVDTIVSVYRAVIEGRPLMHRIVTVTGEAINDPRNFMVPVGMNYHELVEEAGGFKQDPVKVISGGPMMGFALFDLDVPVTKTSSALLCLTEDEVAKYEPTACINCGRCVHVCPSRIIPSRLADLAENQNEETFDKFNGMECIECGSCSYICPAKRRLAQSIKSMRRTLMAKRKK
ncbi:electron transport complex subunit RsxC [Anaerosacchariphilus polymeriproducens]|uniref:Ion-translocating oxidoreductase complex subunit C n=1 Tax=Anaerosacchariphilus polymeriproducens TaxID=1812858 RepID=A0A371AU80_9FIRM|nr:electron transport complex subunit RsxC [Anaerosacchariphilus polymeriproducens]RDU23121.1 electron transport complex subunit RsxC [Anaerosacchariphilus polymeriproducens]